MPELIDVAHISKRGASMRLTLPKKVAELIGAKEEKIIGYYRDGERVYIQLME
jgi:bifunctional DNA-binding transcriptional regulator/antitoxin component of YhaV-PrlF toxin-antitoxin module